MEEFNVNYYDYEYDELIPIIKHLLDENIKTQEKLFKVKLKEYNITHKLIAKCIITECDEFILLHCNHEYCKKKYGLSIDKNELIDIIRLYDDHNLIINKNLLNKLHSLFITTIETIEKEYTN